MVQNHKNNGAQNTNHNTTNHSSGKSQTTCTKHMCFIYVNFQHVEMEVK